MLYKCVSGHILDISFHLPPQRFITCYLRGEEPHPSAPRAAPQRRRRCRQQQTAVAVAAVAAVATVAVAAAKGAAAVAMATAVTVTAEAKTVAGATVAPAKVLTSLAA
jgi:hypothetical protein